MSDQVTVDDNGNITPYAPDKPELQMELRGPASPNAPQVTQDYTCAFLMPPSPGEIAQFAMRKDSAGRLYFAFTFGQGGQGVKVYRRDPDGSVAFLGRVWPAPGYNCAGFDLLLDPPVVAIGMTGHDLHATDPTQRPNGPMWAEIPCGVAPGDAATAVPQEWGANIPAAPAPVAPESGGMTVADLVYALEHNHDLRVLLGGIVQGAIGPAVVGPMDGYFRDRAYEAATEALRHAGLPPK